MACSQPAAGRREPPLLGALAAGRTPGGFLSLTELHRV